jgi:hypothetical protein
MPYLSLRISKNKGARTRIQIVSNSTFLKDYFEVWKFYTFTFNLQVNIAQS